MGLRDLGLLTPGCICLGACLLAAAYHIVLFVYFRDRIFLDYVAYLLCMAMFIFIHTESDARVVVYHAAETDYDWLYRYFNEGVQVLSFTAYINFGIQALGLPANRRSAFYRVWVVLSIVLGVYIVTIVALNVRGTPPPPLGRMVVRLFIFAMCLAILWRLLTMPKSRFQGMVLAGCVFFFVCGLMSFISNMHPGFVLLHPVAWLYLGNLGDIIFFSTAMGYRLKKTYDEREEALVQRNEAVLHERNRIARDMHDDLGSGLTKISILSEVAKTRLLHPDQARQQLDDISASSRELVDNLQDIIWVLNPRNDSLESLAAYIREYALRFFEPLAYEVGIHFPDGMGDSRLTEEQRRNVFLIVKETINNIARHASGRRVLITLEKQPKMAILSLRDDGVGFDPEAVRRFGNGLQNMQSRMEQIGGAYHLESAPGKGTLVRLVIPV